MAASKPTSPLSQDADALHPFTLNQLLGTLTKVRVVPLSDANLTPDTPSPEIYDAQTFGVGQQAEPFRVLNPQSVALRSMQSHSRLDYGLLRQEPAITSLDWLFTPSPRSEEQVHLEPLQTSTRFYPRFILPRTRSTGFGSLSSDSRNINTALLALASCEHVAFASTPLFD